MSPPSQSIHRSVRGRALLAAVLTGIGMVSTAMTLLISVNEYQSTLGIGGAYDCEGPDTVATFVLIGLAMLVPAALLAAWTLVCVVRQRDRSWGRWLSLVVLLVSLGGIAADLARLPEIEREWERNGETGSPCRQE